MAKPKRSGYYLAYWDTLGFECILDLTSYDKQAMWASLADKPPPTALPIHQMIMRAKVNPHRFPEIWTFQSEVDEEELWCYARDNPQGLVDLIREHGSKVFTTPRPKEVIR
jgi:hypothetical protein